MQIDNETGTNLWRKAIKKEMKNEIPAFQILEDGDTLPIGYKQILCHMIFDVKMDGKFTRKARLVANGNESVGVPASHSYSSVVTRESVRIAFLYASLNDLDILSCDVSNAYLNAPCKEKIWTEAGSEFGSDKGSVFFLCNIQNII